MSTRTSLKVTLAVLAGSLLAGCATSPISKTLRQQARKDVTFERAVKDPDADKGALVIWGGYIVDVVNAPGYTELTVLDAPLEAGDQPGLAENSKGRFLARINRFLDPAVYRKGRKVTVAGKITGQETRPLGKIDYAYPVLDVDELHMWARERPYPYDPSFEYGFWYGPGYFNEGFEFREGMEHRR